MGSIYVALLASSGHDVCSVEQNAIHIHAINNHGLRVSGASGDRTVKIKAYTQVPNKPTELLVIAVKATHVKSACTMAKPLINRKTLILTIQNGLGSADNVAEALGAGRANLAYNT